MRITILAVTWLAILPAPQHAATLLVSTWSGLVSAVASPTTDMVILTSDIIASNPGTGIRIPYGRTITIDGNFNMTMSPTTATPSHSPVHKPSKSPRAPSHSPSRDPTLAIPRAPSKSPTSVTGHPSKSPSSAPTSNKPTRSPTTTIPSRAPTAYLPLPPKQSGTEDGRWTIDLASNGRAFLIEHGAALILQNTKIINGVAFNATELTSWGKNLTSQKIYTHPDGQQATYFDSVGGAIFNHGNLTLTNVQLANNLARAGGALFNWGLVLSITDCEFTNNSAAAVTYLGNTTDPHWVVGQTRLMYYDYARDQYWQFWSYLVYNEYGMWKAGNPGYPFLGGGAIAQPNVFNPVYSETYNSAFHGLGPVVRTVFNRNTAIQRGGAIYISAGRALQTSFTDCRFVSNRATYHPDRHTVDRYAEEMMVVFGGAMALVYQQHGGEIKVQSITNTQFEYNEVINEKGGSMGGAISVSVSGGPGWIALEADGVTPALNPAAVITKMDDSQNLMSSTCCGGNRGKSNPFVGSSGAIDMSTTYQIGTISSCTFTENSAIIEGQPTALWVYPAVPVEKSAGGAISSSGNIDVITSCTFTGNQAAGYGGIGGAIAMTGGKWNQMGGYDILFDNFYEGHLNELSYSTFTQNIAIASAGAVSSDHGLIKTVRSVNFTLNNGGDRAGGMSLGRVYDYLNSDWNSFLVARALAWGIDITTYATYSHDYAILDGIDMNFYYARFENNTANTSCAALCVERWTPVVVLDLVATGNVATLQDASTGYGAMAIRSSSVTLRGPWFKNNIGSRGGALGLGNGAVVVLQYLPAATDGDFDPENSKDPSQPSASPTGYHKPAFIGNSGFQGGAIFAEAETSLLLGDGYFNKNVGRSTCLEVRSECKLESLDPGFGFIPQTCGDEINPSLGYCADGVGGDVYTLGGFTALNSNFYGASLPNIYQNGYNYTTQITPVNPVTQTQVIPESMWTKFKPLVGRNIFTHTTARIVQCNFNSQYDSANGDPTIDFSSGFSNPGSGGGVSTFAPNSGGGGTTFAPGSTFAPNGGGSGSLYAPTISPIPLIPPPGRRELQGQYQAPGGGGGASPSNPPPLTTDWSQYAPFVPLPSNSFLQCGEYDNPVCGPRAICTPATTTASMKCDCGWLSKQFGSGVDSLDLGKGCPLCPYPKDIFVLRANPEVPDSQLLLAPTYEQLQARSQELYDNGNITMMQFFANRAAVGYVAYMSAKTYEVQGPDEFYTWPIAARQAVSSATFVNDDVMDPRYTGQCNATYPTCVAWPDIHPLYNITWTWPYVPSSSNIPGGMGSTTTSTQPDPCNEVLSGKVPDWFILYVSPQAGDMARIAFAAIRGRANDTVGHYQIPYVALPMGITWYIGVAAVNGFDPRPSFQATKMTDISKSMADLVDSDGRQSRTDTSTTYRTTPLVDCPAGQISVPHPSGLAECRNCPANEYKTDQYSCTPCPDALPYSDAGANSLSDCGASAGSFSYVDPVTGKIFVASCPSRGICNGGTKVESLVLRRTIWRATNNSRMLYDCKVPSFCWGGSHTQRWNWGPDGYGAYAPGVPPGMELTGDVGKAANISNVTAFGGGNFTSPPHSRRMLEDDEFQQEENKSLYWKYLVEPIAFSVQYLIEWPFMGLSDDGDDMFMESTQNNYMLRRRHLSFFNFTVGPQQQATNYTANETGLFALGDAYCRPGHTGPLCNSCVPGLYMRKGVGCDVCMPQPLSYVAGVLVGQIIAFLFVASVAAGLFLLYEKHAMKNLRAAHNKVMAAKAAMNQAVSVEGSVETAIHSKQGQELLATPEGQAGKRVVTEEMNKFAGPDPKHNSLVQGVEGRIQSMSAESITTKISSVDKMFKRGEWLQQQVVKAKILLSMAQIASSFSITFANVYPADITNVWNAISILGLNFAQFLDLGCNFQSNFYTQALVTCMTPIGFLTLLVIGNQWQLHRLKKTRTLNPDEIKDVRRGLVTSVTALAFLVYPTVSATIVNLFPCEDFSYFGQQPDKSYLRADYSIDCNASDRQGWLAFAWLMVFIYPIGVPVFFFTLLYRKRNILSDPNRDVNNPEVAHLKTLFFSYESGYWYYEVLELLRKLLVTSIVVFFLDGTVTQIVLTLMLSILWVAGLVSNKPYLSDDDDELAALAQFGLIYTLIGGIVLKMNVAGTDGYSSEIYSVMIYISLILAPLQAFYKALTDVFPFLPKGSVLQFFTPTRLVHALFYVTGKHKGTAKQNLVAGMEEQAIAEADAKTGGAVSYILNLPSTIRGMCKRGGGGKAKATATGTETDMAQMDNAIVTAAVQETNAAAAGNGG